MFRLHLAKLMARKTSYPVSLLARLDLYRVQCIRRNVGLRTYANSKASGEPAHPRSLARSFAVCHKFYQGVLLVKANSKASCETVQMYSLVRSFTVCSHKQQTLVKLKANSKASGDTTQVRRLA